MAEEHTTIFLELSSALQAAQIRTILDAGSGRTSLSLILSAFPNASADAVVYPGDARKIDSIKSSLPDTGRYTIRERDLCAEPISEEYDLVVSHLLLGEAAKFGNSFDTLFGKLMAIRFRYLILIDYLEDGSVNYSLIEEYFRKNGFEIVKHVIVGKDPQQFDDFVGAHLAGYLVRRQAK